MDRAEREQFGMTRISYVNQLYGEEELKRAQRREARFVNSGLLATLSGAVASDALEDGRVVSGVGGQYNFVAMAHALEDGRSILMIRAARQSEGRPHSNILWTYGSVTIPRHLRDIVVTEYGIADIRGLGDADVAARLVEIADSRFQEALVHQARRAGKLPSSYESPEACRRNRPQRLDELLAPYRERGLFDPFPFGSELTREEIVLGRALEAVKEAIGRRALPRPRALRRSAAIPREAGPYLERMRLDRPRTARERVLRRFVVYALASADAL
jgi:hypothetical protein